MLRWFPQPPPLNPTHTHKFVKQADLPKVALQVKLMIGVIATSYPRRKNCKCTKEIELLTCVWVTSSLATLIVLIPFKKCQNDKMGPLHCLLLMTILLIFLGSDIWQYVHQIFLEQSSASNIQPSRFGSDSPNQIDYFHYPKIGSSNLKSDRTDSLSKQGAKPQFLYL